MRIIHEFKKFILRGNMVDLVIGFTVGTAFSSIVKSFVDDIIMPPISLLTGNINFEDKFLLLRSGAGGVRDFATLADAKAAGAVTLNYGAFINDFIALIIIGVVMFFIIRGMNRMNERLEFEFGRKKKRASEPSDKKCPYCLSTVPFSAVKCAYCTSNLEK